MDVVDEMCIEAATKALESAVRIAGPSPTPEQRRALETAANLIGAGGWDKAIDLLSREIEAPARALGRTETSGAPQ